MLYYFLHIYILFNYINKIRLNQEIKIPNIYYIKNKLIELKEISNNNNIKFIVIEIYFYYLFFYSIFLIFPCIFFILFI